MRAVVCRELGPPSSLVVDEIDDPVAAPGMVVVDVEAAGVNFPESLIIEGKYQFKPPLPFVLGGEAAGVVREVGDSVDGWAPGDRVIAQTGAVGAFAERVTVPAASLVRLPDGVGFPAAAGLTIAYATTYYALHQRAQVQAGETLLVLGAAGGTGISAVQVGKAMGARVIAAASSPSKLEFCRANGADELIDYTSEDLRARVLELAPNGVDVVYDPVGGDYAEVALRRMAWGGRYLVIGFTAGIPSIPLNLTLLKSCSIVGVFYRAWTMREPDAAREVTGELLRWTADGKIAPPVYKTYALHEAGQAITDLRERKVLGKAIVVPRR